MRVALLMNFVAPYRVPLLEAFRDQVGTLRVLISTPMERDRSWAPEWGTLDVVVQRNVTVRRLHNRVGKFTRQLEIHVPYDTLGQLGSYHPDAVISGELGARSMQAALYKLLRPRMPFLIWATLSEHSETDWGRGRRALRRFILNRADGVLVNGESGARYIASFGVPDERIFRLNQPVDVGMFAAQHRTRPDDAMYRLLFCGMLVKRKGLVPFAKALNVWAAANPGRQIEMWWLGSGELGETLAALKLPPNLSYRFLGQVPYAVLPAVYAQADLLAFPSLMDEWGLVVNEAMAAGLPVLGSIYSQAVEELVTEGVHGWVFDPLSEHSIQAAIDRALSTPPRELAGMRAAVRQKIMGLTPASASDRMAHAVRKLHSALRTGFNIRGRAVLRRRRGEAG